MKLYLTRDQAKGMLGGVKFEIGPGCIRLRGNQRPKLPQAAEGIPQPHPDK